VRKLVLVIATVVCFTGPAIAQPAPAPEAAPPAPAPEAAPPAPFGPPASFGPPSQLEPPGAAQPEPRPAPGRRLSESTALSLSLGGTALSWATWYLGAKVDDEAIGVLGFLGTLFAPNLGHWYRGAIVTRGTGLRMAGAALTVYGFFRMLDCSGGCSDAAGYLFYGGLVLYAVATIDDIITAPLRVRKHNRKLDGVVLTPMVTSHSAGLALGGRF
jgi:hypothetical protein